MKARGARVGFSTARTNSGLDPEIERLERFELLALNYRLQPALADSAGRFR